jgi:hypothetical protein
MNEPDATQFSAGLLAAIKPSMGEQVKGRARIYIDDAVVEQAPVKIEKPKAGEIQWDIMHVRELFDLWRSFILLPEAYSMLGVYFDVSRFSWVMVVESEQLPAVGPGKMLPLLLPSHRREADGKVSLAEMQLIS